MTPLNHATDSCATPLNHATDSCHGGGSHKIKGWLLPMTLATHACHSRCSLMPLTHAADSHRWLMPTTDANNWCHQLMPPTHATHSCRWLMPLTHANDSCYSLLPRCRHFLWKCLWKIIGLFCRIQSLLQGSFAKETYHFAALAVPASLTDKRKAGKELMK